MDFINQMEPWFDHHETKALNDYNNKSEKSVKIRLLIITSILIFIFLYLIEFDLKIFF